MRILILISVMLFCSCGKNQQGEKTEVVRPDTCCDKLNRDYVVLADSFFTLKNKTVRQKTIIDSLRISLNISNGRLSRIGYYVKICKNKPTQKKYFFGWTDRALKE